MPAETGLSGLRKALFLQSDNADARFSDGPTPIVTAVDLRGLDRREYPEEMRTVRASSFTGNSAWDFDPIATIDGATVKLHWTDEPYVWHVNDGEEVFAVLDGAFDMHVRQDGAETVQRLEVGDVFFADVGTEHVAHPVGPSRALVVERKGSI